MSNPIKSPKKLIEVALPLDAINEASAKEKSIRHGHPSTLHLWWARRPLAAARAVIFGQMVNDPSWKWEMEHPGEIPPSNLKASWAASRKRLFTILEEVVRWENTNNEKVLDKARNEIQKSWRETCELNKDHSQAAVLFNPDKLPGLYDPFAGGGAIPLEAQRLGLEAYGSDLNPVAVLINKALIEIPSKFAGRPPVNPAWQGVPSAEKVLRQWHGAAGLAEDVRYYGQWMRDEAQKRIGHLYPPIEVTAEMVRERPDLKPLVGQKLTVIAWLWARTVKSPNPAFRHVEVPLASTFMLSTKAGQEAYVEPVIEDDTYRLMVKVGRPSNPDAVDGGTKPSRGANFLCVMSGTPIPADYVKGEGKAGRMGAKLMAIVAEGARGRVYLSPTPEHEAMARGTNSEWKPEVEISGSTQYIGVRPYGMTQYRQLYNDRQLTMLNTFADLVQAAHERIAGDARLAGLHGDDMKGIEEGGSGTRAYGDAIATYLGETVSKITAYHCTLGVWRAAEGKTGRAFGRQALQMVWDYPECNPFAGAGGDWGGACSDCAKVVTELGSGIPGFAWQAAAQKSQGELQKALVISTDPPYYDNVPYADLSDFYYVWLRRSLKSIFPSLFPTIAAPKSDELVAFAYRHKDKAAAGKFFLAGMSDAMKRLARDAHAAFPLSIYYAFRQAETDGEEGTASTGWEVFLDAVLRAGLAVNGTWPMRTELGGALKSHRNALASSIVLVCRPRSAEAGITSRRAFLRELNQVLPEALDEMTKGAGEDRSPVAPVDLSQAIIGPGMAVFSKYAAVLEADGTPMTVKTALQLINRFLAEDDFDHDTQFCLHWFEQHGWAEGKFGEADTLARAKGTSVDGIKHAGVLYAAGGVVRVLKWAEYPADWEPARDSRLPVWGVLHRMIRVFKSEGESGAGTVLAAVQGKAEATRQLAYRLYTLCERAGWAEDARGYNEIITSWSAIESAATRVPQPKQAALF